MRPNTQWCEKVIEFVTFVFRSLNDVSIFSTYTHNFICCGICTCHEYALKIDRWLATYIEDTWSPNHSNQKWFKTYLFQPTSSILISQTANQTLNAKIKVLNFRGNIRTINEK